MRDGADPHDSHGALEARLEQIVLGFGAASPALGCAMSEATLAPGKRFRAKIMLAAGAATGGGSAALIDAACAVELVHTASLVFDDLPCMDDAQTRRGRSTTHLVHGQGRAILAGIALVTEAMGVLAMARDTDDVTRVGLVLALSQAIGPLGLSAGQDLDLHAAKTPQSVEQEHDLKTGALFVASFQMVALIQKLSASDRLALAQLGGHLGRAFQCYDDLLDAEGSALSLGKDAKRDAQAPGPARGVLAVEGLEAARARYQTQRGQIESALDQCSFGTDLLRDQIARVLPEPVLHGGA